MIAVWGEDASKRRPPQISQNHDDRDCLLLLLVSAVAAAVARAPWHKQTQTG